MDDDIPVVVRMRVECARCGHAEDDTYEFDMSGKKAQPMEASELGKCPECKAPITMPPEAVAAEVVDRATRVVEDPGQLLATTMGANDFPVVPACYRSEPSQPDVAEQPNGDSLRKPRLSGWLYPVGIGWN